MTLDPTESIEGLTNLHRAEVWAGGQRYESAEHALLAVLASADASEDRGVLIREVLRDKFARNHDLGDRLIETEDDELKELELTPTHDLWTGEEILRGLLDVRDELAGQEVMRTGMLLATHGSLVLMGRDSDLGEDLVEGARKAGLVAEIPTDADSLSVFEEAMAEAIAERWGDTTAELFEMGKTVLLYLSMEGLGTEDPEYQQAREETRKVLQESADRLEIDEKFWEILERYGSDPDRITAILRAVVDAALGRPELH